MSHHWNESNVDLIIFMHSFSCSSLMTSGGASRILSPCVGLANNPFSFNRKHTSHASSPANKFQWVTTNILRLSFCFWFFLLLPNLRLSITIAFNNPLPRTIVTISFGNFRNSDRNFSPKR